MYWRGQGRKQRPASTQERGDGTSVVAVKVEREKRGRKDARGRTSGASQQPGPALRSQKTELSVLLRRACKAWEKTPPPPSHTRKIQREQREWVRT